MSRSQMTDLLNFTVAFSLAAELAMSVWHSPLRLNKPQAYMPWSCSPSGLTRRSFSPRLPTA